MTLATHAVTGSLVGAVVATNPVLAALLGFGSHFLLDAIPHWDYQLASAHYDDSDRMKNHISVNKSFIFDLFKIGCDFLLGMIIVYFLFHLASPTIFIGALIGALFAVLPDPLQFVYMKFTHEPFISLQRFHMFMHARGDLNKQHIVGVGCQIILILIVVYLSRCFV